ncbi:reticulon-4-interacting protein 1 homolog, mitochondrial isoform X2 [Lingula anatina]|uniref:NAD(P)H oxidoreductase RTN4IP1, mitochondrial n=1 Tax=Lingula anatina TaxID=7574 RepID=A0A1S3IZD2_LINAN|nr:reticulon-4-interacting protein 1 homolog, mitochondrial isoform X2 [Lingula anatina]|eukprot:XP_013403346.1 reticulon-4-interacting protein 1 homolog, mitochondrial isoform X2 [Lingula anatina]
MSKALGTSLSRSLHYSCKLRHPSCCELVPRVWRRSGGVLSVQCRAFSKRIPGRMATWQIHRYGGNEELELTKTHRTPMIRNPDELLIEVHAASVNPIDVRMRAGYGSSILNFYRRLRCSLSSGSEFPLSLGRDFSGVVVATGVGVRRFKPGDEVWGALGAQRQGAHAEFTVSSESEISLKPKRLSHIEAASIPYAAMTTWAAVSTIGGLNEHNTAGKRVLIYAGSGGVGTFAIQLLKAWGAEVTTTCSTDAVPLLLSLGADNVIDYNTQNVTEELTRLSGFDLVLDTLGGQVTKEAQQYLNTWRNASVVTVVHNFLRNGDTLGVPAGFVKSGTELACKNIQFFQSGQSLRWAVFMPNGEALERIATLVDQEQISPVIEKIYGFEELPEAFDKVSSGHARGKTVIDIKERARHQETDTLNDENVAASVA